MYACCANCQSSTWIEALRPAEPLRIVSCGECAQTYELRPSPDLGSSAAEHYRAMVRLARANQIDMPCAYSVLLGLMPLAQAKAILRGRAQTQPPPEPERVALPENLDPGFHRAVREGSLTVHEALSRGSRDAFAASLVKRHELEPALAFEVADNRMSLRKAIRRAREDREAETRQNAAQVPTRDGPGWRKLAAATIATTCLAVVAGVSWNWSIHHRRPAVVKRAPRIVAPVPHTATEPVDPGRPHTAALSRATEVRKDDLGQVLEITGPDPGSVLSTYCKLAPGFLGVEPMQVRKTVPEFRDARLGVFRDLENGGVLRAIRIRRDARSGRWVAGSGRAPIRTTDAAELPPDEAAIEIAQR